MTLTEVTHTLQHMLSQAKMDNDWFGKVTHDIDDHATIINTTSMTPRTVHKDLGLVREDASRAFDVIEKNDLSIKAIVNDHVEALHAAAASAQGTSDTSLRGDVHAEIKRFNEVVIALRQPPPPPQATPHAQGPTPEFQAKVAAMEVALDDLSATWAHLLTQPSGSFRTEPRPCARRTRGSQLTRKA